MTGFDALPPDARGAVVAFAATLALVGLARLVRRPWIAAPAAAIGLAAGFVAVTGVVSASSRQLGERLPMLALLALAAGLAAALPRRAAPLLAGLAGVLAGAWWMVGAPLHPDTLRQAAPVALGLAGAMALAAWRGGGPAMLPAWGALAAGVALAGARGPHVAFALAGMGAAAAAVLGQGLGPLAARLPLGMALVGVAAVPVLARGAPADAAAAAAAALALLVGPALGRRLPGRFGAWAGPVLAALPAILAAALLR